MSESKYEAIPDAEDVSYDAIPRQPSKYACSVGLKLCLLEVINLLLILLVYLIWRYGDYLGHDELHTTCKSYNHVRFSIY